MSEGKKLYIKDLSAKQKSRLRNGHKVRLKGSMKGEGICMIVNAGSYNLATRAFGANKGVQLNLSPDEIMANVRASQEGDEEITGGNIFKSIGKVAKKVGNKVWKETKRTGRDVAHTAIDIAEEAAPVALGALGAAGATYLGAPQYAPQAATAGAFVGNMFADDVADWAHRGVGKDRRGKQPVNRARGHTQERSGNTLTNQIALNNALQDVNRQQGSNTNYGYMGNAGLGGLASRMERKDNVDTMVRDLYSKNSRDLPEGTWGNIEYAGRGLYAGNGLNLGNGLYAGRGLYAGGEGLYLSPPSRGGQIGPASAPVLPPALQSQPFSQNFQFQHTLPPAYQSLGDRAGNGLYAGGEGLYAGGEGLYAGGGMYAGGGLMEQQVARVANRLAGNEKRLAGNQGKVERRGRRKAGK
jgi:hypothetical protein